MVVGRIPRKICEFTNFEKGVPTISNRITGCWRKCPWNSQLQKNALLRVPSFVIVINSRNVDNYLRCEFNTEKKRTF